jgi:hypothetical protein
MSQSKKPVTSGFSTQRTRLAPQRSTAIGGIPDSEYGLTGGNPGSQVYVSNGSEMPQTASAVG